MHTSSNNVFEKTSLSLKEVALVTGRSLDSIKKDVDADVLQSAKHNGRILVSHNAVVAYLDLPSSATQERVIFASVIESEGGLL